MRFDPERDLDLIALLTTSGNMLVTHPSVPVHSLVDFVNWARTEATAGRPITYATGGVGTPGHLAMEYFRTAAGFDATAVHYRGNPAMVADLLGGQIKAAFIATAGMTDHVSTGRLKPLAVSRRIRSEFAPQVPAMAEAGYPDFEFETYFAMVAPRGLPSPIRGALEKAAVASLSLPDVVQKLLTLDTAVLATTGSTARDRVRQDRSVWAKVVKATGMKPE